MATRKAKKIIWQGYDLRADDAEVIRLFRLRYGQPPEQIVRGKVLVLAGPVPGPKIGRSGIASR